MKIKVRKDAVLREIAGEYILVPVGASALERTGLYVLSDVAKILEPIPELDSVDEIVTTLIDRETLTTDTKHFLEYLKAMHFME